MLKKKYAKRMMAGILAMIMMLTTAFQGNVLNVEAASVYETQNLLVNADFEDSTAFGAAGGSHYGNWFVWQDAAKVTTDAQSGNASVRFSGSDSALEQDLNGAELIQGMTYVYTVWAKVSGTTSQEHIVGVKNYGGNEIKRQVTSTNWEKYEIEFVYTSGNPRIYGYVGNYDGVDMYIDNASVVVKSDVESVEIENGILTVDFSDARTEMPSISEVSATYLVAPENVSGTVQWLDAEWDPVDKIATLYFEPFKASAEEQTVTVSLTYGGATITLDYTIEEESVYDNQNFLINPDFEDSTAFGAAGGSHYGNWFVWQNAEKVTTDAQSGNASVRFSGSDSALEQDLNGADLVQGTTYVYTVWAKLSGTTNEEHIIGVKNYGGDEVKHQVTSTNWEKYEIEFVYTSGNPRVYGYVGSHDGVDMYIDNASVVMKSNVEQVVANLTSVEVINGQLNAILDANPTIVPKASDFVFEYKVSDGAYKNLSVSDFDYNEKSKTVTVRFERLRSLEECVVSVKVTYRGNAVEDTFALEASESNTYYVDATNGNDSNAGLSEDSAFASIDKLNKITFLPGDQILFKKGETFVGCFKPQGSGNDESPIIVGSYGEGNERPVLQPGADWTVEYIMSANAMESNVKVNYVLQFYNVEYWEVSDLEIFDPNSEAYLTPGSGKYIGNSANDVYRSGITIQAEDIGVLEHFYIDNVIIHGFHGPGTNIGKTSGGITMNVITNKERNRELSVPTQINDIKITNCEIYDVGRSGINFLTPWSFRTEEKWGPFNYGTRGYDYLPYEDFYMANNYIHDIDGDGTIIDNCSNAVCEYNLVTRCCLRPATEGGGAAVGLFNWNSDDTYFQFNEVYDVRLGSGVEASNDGQGIEIDALNDRTWVQYNYVHDNWGGFMMLCNVGDNYRSFDGIVRYNISQDDFTHPRQGLFDIYSANYGTEIYNNTFYLTDRAVSKNGYENHVGAGQLFLFSAVGSYETMKFYNNIFYYDGETPVEANTFGNNAIDWQSNIFYGFANLPENDNENAPNISADPKVVNIGAGGTGTTPGTMPDLSCYYLSEDSPAVNAGVIVENNGGRDFFGNKVSGIPDVGAYDSGAVILKLMSNSSDVLVDQDGMTITVTDTAKISVNDLMDSLVYESGVTVFVKRGIEELVSGIRLAEGDLVSASYDGQTISYTVKVVEATEEVAIIPPERTNATAGSQETTDSTDVAENVLDGNTGTIWHTSWGGAEAADRYLTLEIKDGLEYEISGYVYTPRTGASSGARNGIITGYEIYVSDDNATWTSVAKGTWTLDSTVKTVTFTPVKAKYVKLLATESVGDYASAAEARLIGSVYDIENPTAPVLSVKEIAENSVVLNWTESVDNTEISEYVLMNNGTVIAMFDAGTTSYKVNGLEAGKNYTFEIYAVDIVGNESAKGSCEVAISKVEFVDVKKGSWYEKAVNYVSARRIMTGTSETTFEPAKKVSRAVIVTTLYKLAGSPEVDESFDPTTIAKDYKANTWWSDALKWALSVGVATGNTSTNKFEPSKQVTRQELATFLERYARLVDGETVEISDETTALVESLNVPNWAKAGFSFALETGIITGITNGTSVDYSPKGTTSRAQLATMLMRYCDKK